MKRITIQSGDKTYYAKPLVLAQFEELETKINAISDLEVKALTSPGSVPLDLLRARAEIVYVGLRNHDAGLSDTVMKSFSAYDITRAFEAVLSGSGVDEVPEGNGPPVA